ncbi:MAG: alpha-2-macroglobulin family protein, partial [Candidatus Bathyarchaeia archaeon]
MKIEEGIAPDTGYAQITGTVTGAGVLLPSAQVRVRRQEAGRVFRTVTSSQGEFIYSALKPGSYELTVEAEGHHGTVYAWIVVKARDRAVLSVPLERATGGAVLQLALNNYYNYRGKRNGRPMRDDMELDMLAVRAAPAAGAEFKPMAKEERADGKGKTDQPSAHDANTQESGGEQPKVRSYFPETLYVNPTLITDASGRARVKIPMADSITTWRVSMMGSTKRGLLGSATTGIRVFQDFFIDIDLPVALTQNDTVQIPVAVYNYLSDAQIVEVTLKQEDWFELVDDVAVKTVKVGAEEVTAVNYRIRASRIGSQVMTVSARLTERSSAANGDAIARSIEIRPDGERREAVVNDRLDATTTKEIEIPENSIPDASKILVKFYPGPLSQVVEGLDSILRMPNGCFEQTSSANYPNVLVLDYMKTTKRITPEIQAKAEGFVSLGYQKLVTFEVAGGGFSWFGDAPANKILTGFGLMQFYDMSHVHEVDPRLIRRTQDWLAAQQKPDGSWEPDARFIDEGATNNYHDDRLRIAAYLGWVLAYSGYSGEAVNRAKQYVEKTMTGKEDPYTLAVIANFAADFKRDNAWIERASNALIAKVTEQERSALWKMENVKTPTYAQGGMADIETTALAAQALIKAGRSPQLAAKALQFLTEKKDAYGNWHSTQATILALKAFLLSQTRGVSADTEGVIAVKVNGKEAATFRIDKDNNDLLHQVDLKASTGRNRVELAFSGKGSLLYQIVGRYYTPWTKKIEQQEPLSIDLKYDRTRLEQDDIATATVTVRNQMRQSAKMVMIDLGIPPGFEVLAEDLQEAVHLNAAEKFGNLTKFTVTARQIVLYLDGLKSGQSFSVKYRLKAKYPLKAKTPESRVYQYYNPEIGSKSQPVELSV